MSAGFDNPVPLLSDSELTEGSDSDFIRLAYRRILDRNADPIGLANYQDALAQGKTRAAVALELTLSEEGSARWPSARAVTGLVAWLISSGLVGTVQCIPDEGPAKPCASLEELLKLWDADFVRAAFLTVLGRPVDAGGLDAYLSQLRGGVSRHAIIAALVASEEGIRVALTSPEFAKLAGRFYGIRSLPARIVRRIRRLLLGSLETRLNLLENVALGMKPQTILTWRGTVATAMRHPTSRRTESASPRADVDWQQYSPRTASALRRLLRSSR